MYADGTQYRGRTDEVPVNWDKLDITRIADRLQGHLLITYGDSDEESLPSHPRPSARRTAVVLVSDELGKRLGVTFHRARATHARIELVKRGIPDRTSPSCSSAD